MTSTTDNAKATSNTDCPDSNKEWRQFRAYIETQAIRDHGGTGVCLEKKKKSTLPEVDVKAIQQSSKKACEDDIDDDDEDDDSDTVDEKDEAAHAAKKLKRRAKKKSNKLAALVKARVAHAYQLRDRAETEQKEIYVKIFAYILLKLTRTSLDLVESHADYTAAHSAKDPVLLWDIVLDTHESSLYN